MSRSVFDFLYQDTKRVGSLLSQFDANGLLTSLTQTEGFSEGTESTFEFGGGISLLAAKGDVKEADKSSEGFTGAASRGYDPLWKNAINLLTLLDNEGMIQRRIGKAGLGQLVLASGSLEVFDIPMLKVMFSDMEVIRSVIEASEGKKFQDKEWRDKKKAFAIIATLPLSVQAMLATEADRVWAVLNSECLQISATNLFLKYGVSLFGTWHMLGILDAIPDPNGPAPSDSSTEPDTAMDLIRHLVSLHEKLGRPKTAYSMTPLLIFRVVNPTPVAEPATPGDGADLTPV